MNDHTWEEIEANEDLAERLVHELSNELSTYEEESEEWYSVHYELCDAENELTYWQLQREYFTDV